MIKNSEAIPCRLDAFVLPPLFPCIVVDPPWEVKFGEDRNRDKRVSTGSPKGTWSRPNMNYNTMTLEEIKRLPVGQLAEENAHLYLWTITNI